MDKAGQGLGILTWRTGASQGWHILVRFDSRVTDEQQQTSWTNPATPESAPLSVSETPNGTEPPPTKRFSRRMVLLLAGIGVSGAAALGTGAYAYYESQSNNQNGTTQGNPGGQAPQGYGSGMPRRNRSGMPSGARPSGVRPSGARTGGFPSGAPGGNASGLPTDQPT